MYGVDATTHRRQSAGGQEMARQDRATELPFQDRSALHYIIEGAGLEGCYLKFFIDTQLPNLPGRTCRDLLAAWHVILDLALQLVKEVKSIITLTARDARRISLEVSGTELRRIVGECLKLARQDAHKVVEFLTFRPSSKREPAVSGRPGLGSDPEQRFICFGPAGNGDEPTSSKGRDVARERLPGRQYAEAESRRRLRNRVVRNDAGRDRAK